MRLPRARVTIRWIMVLIALVAVLLFGVVILQRRAHFLSRADYHARRAEQIRDSYVERSVPLAVEEYHESMAKKYEQAARHPWAEIEPYPPAP